MRLFLSIVVFFATQIFAFAQSDPADAKLAAYFPFTDCDGTDKTGRGSSAALNGTVACDCGVRDNALTFDGADDNGIFVGNLSSVFSTGDFAISFYIKPKRFPLNTPLAGSTQMIMSKQEACNRDNAFWVRYRQQGQTVQSSNIITTGISEDETLVATLTAKLDDDRCWHHVVVSRQGPTYTLYVNGVKKDEKSTAIRIDLTGPANFTLSTPVCTTDGNYYGSLDELRFYNRPFDEETISKQLALRPDEIVNGDTLVYLGTSFEAITTESCAQGFIWSPSSAGIASPTQSTTTITPTAPTTYKVTFIHPDNCFATDTVFVNVIDPDTLDCIKIFIPNAFTPGTSSGRNDVFGISNPFTITEFISFEVFDRWGGKVFSGASQTDKWDGTFNGTVLNPGIFLYRLRYRCKGNVEVRSGTVTLIR